MFKATLGPSVTSSTVARLYVRPEYSKLLAKAPAGSNSLPVTVTDVSFEGNFINIHVTDKAGHHFIVETRNDTGIAPPSPGTTHHLCFDAANAFVLADQGMKDPSLDE